MDIQALEILSNLAAITTKQGSGDAEVVSGDFSRLLNEINTMQSVSDMQEEICKKFNVTLHVVDYACNTTDQTAENFDLAMLDRRNCKKYRSIYSRRWNRRLLDGI